MDADERTLDKSDLRASRVTVGCDKLASIPKEFNAVFGKKICKITIRVESRFTVPMDPEIKIGSSVDVDHGEGAPATS